MLVHWNNSRWVDMSLHSDTLFWFRANQSLFFLIKAVCLVEKQLALLTYIIYFSYAKFLTDYNNILKIAGGVKQLTVPLLSDRTVPCPRTMHSASFLSSAPVTIQFVGQTRWQIGLKMCLMKTSIYYWTEMVWLCWNYHLQWICGYVHVYMIYVYNKIIKQLSHACSGNSQNYWPEVMEMTWELLPFVLGQQFSSHLHHLGSAEGNSFQVISSTSGQ